MKLGVVVKIVSMNSLEGGVIHQRPALIQEVDWRPGRYPGSSPDTDAVKDIMFSFCNGELLRMRIPGLRYPQFRLRRSDPNGAGEWRLLGEAGVCHKRLCSIYTHILARSQLQALYVQEVVR